MESNEISPVTTENVLKIGGLFFGYGGLDMAVESVFGGELAWVSEFDKGACKIIEHRHPGIPNIGDITKVNWADVEPVDIITGGSPCQDLSTAGRRAGMTDGTRSNLWVAMREAVETIRPRFVVWENVRGAFSAPADSAVEPCPGCVGDGSAVHLRALGRVLGDLSDLRYDTEWHSLLASDVGAPHGRFRVFVVAADAQRGGFAGWTPDALRSAFQRAAAPRGGKVAVLPSPTVSDTNGAGKHGDGGLDLRTAVSLLPTPTRRDHKDHTIRLEPHRPGDMDTLARALTVTLLPTPVTEPDTGNGHARNLGKEARLLPTPRATDGTKGGPNQRGSSGDLMLPSAVVLLPTPSAADGNGGGRSNSKGHQNTLPGTAKLLPTVRVKNNENRQSEGYGGEDGNFYGVLNNPERWGQYADAIERWEAFTRPAPDPTETGPKGAQRLSPRFTEWMMGLPDGWITDVPGITRNEALKACGNGVVPQQAAAALRLMLTRSQGVAA